MTALQEQMKLAVEMSTKYNKPFIVVKTKLNKNSKKSWYGIQNFVNQKDQQINNDGSYQETIYKTWL